MIVSTNWLSEYVDLPDLALDLFHEAPDRMAAMVEQYLGDGSPPAPQNKEDR